MVIALRPCEGVTPRCATCHDDALDGMIVCPECRTLVHVECRDDTGCPTLGCAEGARHAQVVDVRKQPRPGLRSRLVALMFVPLLPRLATWLCLGVLSMLGLAHSWVSMVDDGTLARVERVRADMRSIGDALELYRIDTGQCPDHLRSLWQRPVGVSRWKGPYLSDGPPRDPWGNEYRYGRTGERSYKLLSFGADGQPGGVDAGADLSSRAINAAE